jgi:hypothetical protein
MPMWADLEPGLYGVEVWKSDDCTADLHSTGLGVVLLPTGKEMRSWWAAGLGSCNTGFAGGFSPFTTCYVLWKYGEGDMMGTKWWSDSSRKFNYKATPGEYDLKVDLCKVTRSEWAESEFLYTEIGCKFKLMKKEEVREAVSNVKGLLLPGERASLQSKLEMRAEKWLNKEHLKCNARRQKLKARLEQVWKMQEDSPCRSIPVQHPSESDDSESDEPTAKKRKIPESIRL